MFANIDFILGGHEVLEELTSYRAKKGTFIIIFGGGEKLQKNKLPPNYGRIELRETLNYLNLQKSSIKKYFN